MMRRALASLLCTAGLVAALHAQQPRDGRALPTGTASISGVVVTGDSTAAPVRRAIVEVAGVVTLTDDEGRFTFNRLQAGGHAVLVNKAGFLPGAYGAKRPGGVGVAVDVRDGQRVSGLRVGLFKGGVLSGVVTDAVSRPAPYTEVRAFRYGIDADTGQRLPMPVTAGLGVTITDDKGAFRLYGLEPGDYVVSVAPAAASGAVRLTTEEDVRYALQLLRLPPGAPLDSSSRRPATKLSSREGGGTRMFYASGESIADATRVTLGLGEERQGIDVVRRRVSTGLVYGNVSGPFAAIREGGKVHLIDTESPFTDSIPWVTTNGAFTFSGVPPGHYEVVALSEKGGLLGRSEAFVIAAGEVALSMVLEPGATVAGRLVFQTTSGQAADSSLVRLTLTGASRADFPFRTSPADAEGRFSWSAVPVGTYRLGVTTTANLQPGWRAKSAMLGGVDVLDGAFDVTSAGAGELVITLTDARSEISGTLQSPDGGPVSDYSVLVFSSDRQFWRPLSRRTQIVRPNSNGRFALRDLPEGEYFIVALSDVEPGEWHVAQFLAELAPFATTVSLADGEKKTQDMRIARR